MSISLKRVSLLSPDYNRIRKLYLTAFPTEERTPFPILMAKSGKDGADFWAVYKDDNWIGIAYNVSRRDITYLFYLAVAESERGKGYGSLILKTLKRYYEGQRYFLALEQLDENAENYTERVSRRRFYEKNGFAPMNCRIKEAKVTYDVMCIGGSVSPEEYKELMGGYLGKFFHKLIPMEIIPGEDGKENSNEA